MAGGLGKVEPDVVQDVLTCRRFSLANTVGMAIADLIVPEMVPDEGSVQFNVSYTRGNYHMCN